MPSASELIDRGWEARRKGRLQEAHSDLAQAVRACRDDAAEPSELVRALKALAHVERDLGRDEEGRALYEEAEALDRGRQDVLSLAHTVRHLGDVHRDAGRTRDAERCYLEALSLYEASLDAPVLDVANALRPLAILRESQDRIEESRELWARARALYAEAGIDAGVRECDAHLSDVERSD